MPIHQAILLIGLTILLTLGVVNSPALIANLHSSIEAKTEDTNTH